MASINVNGTPITVDDSFMSMSPADQNTTVDHIANQLNNAPRGPVADAVNSTLSGVRNGAAGILGAPGDIQAGIGNAAEYLGRRALDAVGVQPPAGSSKTSFYKPYADIRAENAAMSAPTTMNLPGGASLPLPIGGGLPGADSIRAMADAPVNAAAGNPGNYTPQTPAGKILGGVASFVPAAAMTGGLGAPNLLRQAVAPGVASEIAGEATKGTPIEPWARGAAALATGAVGGALSMPSGLDANLARVGEGLNPTAFAAVQDFIEKARASGIAVTIPEAIDHLTNGATGAGNVMRLANMSPAGQAVTNPFYAQRAGQMSTAVDNMLDKVAPAAASPAVVGTTAMRAAGQGIDAVRQDLNASTAPLYAASENTLIPHQVFMAINTPAFSTSLARLRNDPVLGPQYANMPSNSIGVIDAVTKDMMAQGEAAKSAVSGAAGFNPHKGAILTEDAALARNVAGRVDPNYAQALAEQAAGRQNVLEPLQNTSAGAIANTPAVPAQTTALFPTKPTEGLSAETAATLQMLEQQIPGSAAALVRQHLANQAGESMQANATGPNAWGGAKFAAAVAGNPLQEANLNAGLAALPNGATAGPAVSNLIEILRATGRRQAIGSLTAPNSIAQGEMAAASAPQAVVESAINPFGIPAAIRDSIGRARLGSRSAELAKILLGEDPAASIAKIEAAQAAAPTIGGVFSKALGQADASQQQN
jgi:hypothetical protein